MPQLIYTTDEIGSREGRDILFLSFRDIPKPKSLEDEPWERITERNSILHGLDDQGIAWEPCLHCSPGTMATPYRGAIYLNVVPDERSARYRQLLAFLEDDSGQCRFAGVEFWLVPLEKSLKWYEQRQAQLD